MPDRFLKKPPIEQGTTTDNDKRKSHWAKKPTGYIKDQLDKRGQNIPAKMLKGPNGLKKPQLLKMLYNLDKNIV